MLIIAWIPFDNFQFPLRAWGFEQTIWALERAFHFNLHIVFIAEMDSPCGDVIDKT